MDNSARLREERERLGLSQEALGVVGGVRKQAQHLYESGARKPDMDYLTAVASAGVDVLYVLTGQRTGGAAAPAPALAPDEEILLDNYRHAPAGVRAGVKTTLETFAPGAGGCKRGKAA